MRLQSLHPKIGRTFIRLVGEDSAWRGSIVSSRGLSDSDWVGRGHQLGMYVPNQVKPAIFDPAIVKLRRPNVLWMDMSHKARSTLSLQFHMYSNCALH